MNPLTQKLESIRNEIEKRKTQEKVRILGATKFQSVEIIQSAVEAGLIHLGVNYAQEGAELQKKIQGPVVWHFIGHIQSRKVKYLTSYQMVHSLDRLEIAELLQKRLEAEQKTCQVLVEVNIGDETSKSGIAVERLGEFLKSLKGFSNLETRGLMIMPPPLNDIEARRPYFRRAKSQYDTFQPQFGFDTLSMGTSEDYLVAVEEGSNMVRLGTTLFGKRIQK